MSKQTHRAPRHQLILKVEYDHPRGFLSDYLHNLSDGGLLLNSEVKVGQVLQLRISFPGLVAAIEVDAICRWTKAETSQEEPRSGLEFVNMGDEARAGLASILEAAELAAQEEAKTRVVLLERNSFLKDVYGQEVYNWAELESTMLELVVVEDVEAWVEATKGGSVALTVVDVDGLDLSAVQILERLRAELTGALPLIILGTQERIRDVSTLRDETVFALSKPLDFGSLMSTIRLLLMVR